MRECSGGRPTRPRRRRRRACRNRRAPAASAADPRRRRRTRWSARPPGSVGRTSRPRRTRSGCSRPWGRRSPRRPSPRCPKRRSPATRRRRCWRTARRRRRAWRSDCRVSMRCAAALTCLTLIAATAPSPAIPSRPTRQRMRSCARIPSRRLPRGVATGRAAGAERGPLTVRRSPRRLGASRTERPRKQGLLRANDRLIARRCERRAHICLRCVRPDEVCAHRRSVTGLGLPRWGATDRAPATGAHLISHAPVPHPRSVGPERGQCAPRDAARPADYAWRFWMLAHSSRRPTVRWKSIGSRGSWAK